MVVVFIFSVDASPGHFYPSLHYLYDTDILTKNASSKPFCVVLIYETDLMH